MMKSIQKMANITKLIYIGLFLACIIAILGGIIAFMQNIESFASFEVGFVGFLFIVGSSFFALLKRVKSKKTKSQNNSEESKNTKDDIESDKSPNFSARFILGTQMSLSFLRILSYIIFAILLIGLLEYQLFNPIWFGIGLCMGIVIPIGLCVRGILKH